MGVIYKIIRFFGWLLFVISLILFIIILIAVLTIKDLPDKWVAIPIEIVFALLSLAGWKIKKIKGTKPIEKPSLVVKNQRDTKTQDVPVFVPVEHPIQTIKKESIQDMVREALDIRSEVQAGKRTAEIIAASPKKPRAPARRKTGATPIWEGKVYYLEYQAEDGAISERKIKINEIENGGRPRNSYIHAFCFQASAMRTFRFDRIIGLYDDDQEIENPFYYFTEKQNRPARVNTATLAAEALKDDVEVKP
jgi:hypothetical protein